MKHVLGPGLGCGQGVGARERPLETLLHPLMPVLVPAVPTATPSYTRFWQSSLEGPRAQAGVPLPSLRPRCVCDTPAVAKLMLSHQRSP